MGQTKAKDFGYYGNMGKSHWKRLRPKMYAELKKNGQLESALRSTQKSTSREVASLLANGFRVNEAEELVLPKYVLLGAEEDERFTTDRGISAAWIWKSRPRRS
jgi:hypothetical protein